MLHIVKFDGGQLKELRKARKWDQHRLAENARAHGVGITQSQISRYENGQEPSGRNAVALAAALDCSVSDLYTANGSSSDDEEESRRVQHRDVMEALHYSLSVALGKEPVRA